MSVIFGLCNFNNKPVDAENLYLMQSRLNHWQADKAQLITHQQIGFGHLMLYNTPQSLAEQLPFHDSLSGLVITADARLDNREELFKKLGIKENEQVLLPDSQLILKAYQKYGSNCVKHLLGDFVFVIYDSQQQQLFCGRDHLGVKPFFYYQDSTFFAFASEKKGILALPNIDQAINKQFFYNLLYFGSEQFLDHTLYQKIKKLKPAHFLIINLNTGNSKTERYWTLDVHTELKYADTNEYYEGLRYHFEEAVKCRTLSSYKVGAELSGGMDSSAITGAAQTYLKSQNKSVFTLSNTLSKDITDPEITQLDERQYIDCVNDHFDIQNRIYVTKPAFNNRLEQAKFTLDVNDGFERWDSAWLYPLKKAAKENDIRTLLSGFPGDELVTYRGKFYFLDYRDKKQYLKYWLAKKKYPGFNKTEPFIPHQVKYGISKIKRSLGIQNHWVKNTLKNYNIPAYYQQHVNDAYWLDPYYQEQFKSYRHFQRNRILHPHVTHRMESETRYGIYCRTEPRFPMADIRLIQYYISLPNRLKYEGELSRTLYRKAVAPYLPPLILQRDSKYGSVAPFLSAYPINEQQNIQALIEQLPNLPFLKKEVYNTEHSKTEKRKFPNHPSMDLMLWITKNENLLRNF